MALQVARLPGTSNVTAAVFARWLSLVYMTLVQLGAVFSGGYFMVWSGAVLGLCWCAAYS
jgi:hypothetical protein